VLALALAAMAAVAMRAEAATLAELAAAIDRVATEPEGDRVVVGHISRTLATSAETLRADRARTGLGWGDLLIAYRLSREAELPFEGIVADVRSGKDWPQIVDGHMELATLTAEVERSKEMIEQRSEDKGPPSGRPAARQTGGGGSGRGGRRR
jgi:hypothetical protein